MKKVFIPSIPTRYDVVTDRRVPSVDLNQASVYGDLVKMIDYKSSISTKEGIMLIKEESKNIHKDDLILAVGDLVYLAATIHFVSLQNGVANLLRWDRRTKQYYTEEVELC